MKSIHPLVLAAIIVVSLSRLQPATADENELLEAAREGNLPAVRKTFLGHPEAIRMKWQGQPGQPEDGFTMLHFAARRGDAEMCEFLIRSGAPVNAKDAQGQTPLHLAANTRVIAALINGEADVNAEDIYGQTPLGVARNADIAKLLLNNRAAVNRPIKSPLHFAAAAGRLDVVRTLLLAGAEIDAVVPTYTSPINGAVTGPYTAMYMAAQGGHDDVIALLAAHNAAVDAPEVKPQSHSGKAHGEVPVVAPLAPLWGAVAGGHPDTVRLLLQLGATPKITGEVGRNARLQTAPTQWTLLHLAATNDPHGRVTRELLRAGLKPEVHSNEADGRRTPLHIAAEQGNLAVAKLLIAYGANVEALTADGKTPLMLAAPETLKPLPSNREATAQLLRFTGALR